MNFHNLCCAAFQRWWHYWPSPSSLCKFREWYRKFFLPQLIERECGIHVVFCQLLSIFKTCFVGMVFLTGRSLCSLPLCFLFHCAVSHQELLMAPFCCVASGVFSVVTWSLRGSSWDKRLKFESLLLTQWKPEEFVTGYDDRLCNMSSDSCMRPVTSGMQHLCLFRKMFSSISVPPGAGEITVSQCRNSNGLLSLFRDGHPSCVWICLALAPGHWIFSCLFN